MKKTMPTHTKIKLLETSYKEENLKAAREKAHITYRGIKITITGRFHIKNNASEKTVEQHL